MPAAILLAGCMAAAILGPLKRARNLKGFKRSVFLCLFLEFLPDGPLITLPWVSEVALTGANFPGMEEVL